MAWLVGVALVAACAVFGREAARFIGTALMGFEKSPVSGVMFAILVGLVIANAAPRVVEKHRATLRFFTTTVLRLGIVLLGLRLSLVAASSLGLEALPVVLLCIAVALLVVTAASRWLGLSRELGSLIAVGTSICGVTAIAATAPLIRAREIEISYATACITLFGMAALLAYPAMAHALFSGQPVLAGIFLGTSVHDTAQVAGAGLMYQEQFRAAGALEAATVTKLVRNLFMALVIPLVAIVNRRRLEPAARDEAVEDEADSDGAVARPSDEAARPPLVPLFVVGFVAMCAVRTIGDMGEQPLEVLSPDQWRMLLEAAHIGSEWALTLAMAAVGLQTRFAAFRQLGLRPLALGLFAAALVGAVSAGALMWLQSTN
jgi:uncharacterized integral membrane protein (TIGR00698 family)